MTQQLASVDRHSIKSQRLALALALLALALGLAATAAGVLWVKRDIQSDASARFARQVNRIQADVQSRFNAPLWGLRGALGVYAASQTVERAEFRVFVAASQLGRDFPGVRGIGFIAPVQRADLDRFVADQRADGAPAFSVSSAGNAPDLFVVKFIEPLADNQAALGLDAGAEAVRREAIERAIASGEPTLSQKISLLQDRKQGAAFVYLLPIFHPGSDASTPERRRAALLGLLFAPIVVSEIMDAGGVAASGQIDVDLFDGPRASAKQLIYDPDGHLASAQGLIGPAQYADRLLHGARTIAVGGRSLTLYASSRPSFEAEVASPLPALLGLVGGLLSLLLALSIWLLGSSRSRALAVAQRMTLSLAQEQQRLRSIVDGTHAGTWEWNVPSGEIRIDARWTGIIGYTAQELQPADIALWRKHLHPDDLLRSDSLLAQHFAGDLPYYDQEVRLRHKDGHWVWALSRGQVSAWTDDGKPSLMAGTLMDISARKLAQGRLADLHIELELRVAQRTSELEASNRDLQDFAYSVAHDLRQPFIAIGGFSSLLERLVDNERGKHYLARIKAGVAQAGARTEALLALANLSRVQLRLQAVDLSAIAQSVAVKLQQQDGARSASIQIASGLLVHGDPLLLRQVMEALLGNAWKFSSRQSHTEISFGIKTAPAGAVVRTVYVVKDNGEGFDMAHVDSLFQSFQSLHSAQDFPGVGIGLANIQRIITRHGGQIWAQSAPGQGASFYFTLGMARS